MIIDQFKFIVTSGGPGLTTKPALTTMPLYHLLEKKIYTFKIDS